MAKRMKETKHVVIPRSLAKRIERVVSGRLGYVTVSEFVRQAIREKLKQDQWRLDEIEKRSEEQKKAAEAYEKLGLET